MCIIWCQMVFKMGFAICPGPHGPWMNRHTPANRGAHGVIGPMSLYQNPFKIFKIKWPTFVENEFVKCTRNGGQTDAQFNTSLLFILKLPTEDVMYV